MATLEAYGKNIVGSYGTVDSLISDKYNSSATYNTGDYCIYNNALYKCKSDNVTGTWNATKWDLTNVDTELTSINSDLSDVTYTTDFWTTPTSYLASWVTVPIARITKNRLEFFFNMSLTGNIPAVISLVLFNLKSDLISKLDTSYMVANEQTIGSGMTYNGSVAYPVDVTCNNNGLIAVHSGSGKYSSYLKVHASIPLI